jgi:hypothetical protein
MRRHLLQTTAVLTPAVRQRPFVAWTVWSVFRIERSSLPRTRSTRPRPTADFLSNGAAHDKDIGVTSVEIGAIFLLLG